LLEGDISLTSPPEEERREYRTPNRNHNKSRSSAKGLDDNKTPGPNRKEMREEAAGAKSLISALAGRISRGNQKKENEETRPQRHRKEARIINLGLKPQKIGSRGEWKKEGRPFREKQGRR